MWVVSVVVRTPPPLESPFSAHRPRVGDLWVDDAHGRSWRCVDYAYSTPAGETFRIWHLAAGRRPPGSRRHTTPTIVVGDRYARRYWRRLNRPGTSDDDSDAQLAAIDFHNQQTRI